MKNLKVIYSVIVLLCIFYGCKKGDAGAPGNNGTNGTNGNANVHTKIFTVDASSWNATGSAGAYYNVFNVNDSDITQGIADSGTVLVYVNSNPWWNALPYANNNLEWRYEYLPNIVKLINLNADGTKPPNPGTLQFKITTIAAN